MEGKHPGGRPLLFKSPEELQEKIEAYFDKCDNRRVEKFAASTGKIAVVHEPEPYTIAGLAVALKCDPDTIRRYGKKEEFYATIKAAKARIENDVSIRRTNLLLPAAGHTGYRGTVHGRSFLEVSCSEKICRQSVAQEVESGQVFV